MVPSNRLKVKHVKSQNDTSNDEPSQLEVVMARRLRRYKGKLPIIYFSCKKLRNIATWCIDRDDRDEIKDTK